MSLHSWLQNLRYALSPGRGRRNHQQRGSLRPATYRPNLEMLEDRTVLSTFTVLNLADSGEGSLRQAVFDANAQPGADVIDFADGLSGTIPLTTGQLSVTDALTINGPRADLLAVSGSHQSRIFSIIGGTTVAIAGLTITDGKAVGNGGGILNTGSTLSLDQVILSDNQAVSTSSAMARGGAVANLSSASLTVTDCLFIQNQALGGSAGGANGGAIANNASRLVVSHSSFLGNESRGGDGGKNGLGGAIDIAMSPSTTVSECTFVGNRAIGGNGGVVAGAAAFEFIGGGLGGAIRSGNSTLAVEDSTFTNNQAIGGNGGVAASTAKDYDISFGYGGGLFNFSGTAVVSGSTFTHNQAIGGSHGTATFGRGHVGDGSGGGMINLDNATATVTNSVFDHNEAHGGEDNVGGSSLTGGAGAFIVGWGLGGAITNEGWNRAQGTTLIASNLTLTHNRAVGGDGNTGNDLAGAGVGGGLASWWRSAVVTISDSTITHNQAVGGSGGDGLGGGLANVLGSTLTVAGCMVDKNLALGSDGVDGAGGNGLGGGVYNDAGANDVPSSLHLVKSISTKNHANGAEGSDGGSDGEGIGGGVYNLGAFDLDAFTLIFKNYASTSHDDVFDPFA